MQYEYATRIGFSKAEILCNLLSANSDIFTTAASERAQSPSAIRNSFLYVGRFAKQKGIDILINAYRIYKEKYQGHWTLTCIGNGPMAGDLGQHADISVEGFQSQKELSQQAKSAGAFILPSRYEPWGVVVHEFASAGLPLILSERVGARPQFLIDGANGYTFYQDSAEDLAHKMSLISKQSKEKLDAMGMLSARLAAHITPEIAAASFMSVVSKERTHA
jgi:glycosyltransferase involved in cell wall biosynthesis